MIIVNKELQNLDRIFACIADEFFKTILKSIPELTRQSIFEGLIKATIAACDKGLITCEEKEIFINRKELSKTNQNIKLMTEVTEQYVFDFCFA